MRKWTEKEYQFVADNHGKLSNQEIATALGRTYSSVNLARVRLGLVEKQPPWTEPDKEYLIAHKDSMTDSEIAVALGRSVESVGAMRRKLNGSKNRRWTPEEEEILRTFWGTMTMQGLCKKLDRSRNAIMVRIQKLGLPPYLESGDYITINQLHKAFCGTNFSTYQLKSWVNDRGMPIHNKRRGKNTYRVIYLDEFWEWAEKHRSFLDFSKLEPLALGKEPAWVVEQRHKDFRANALQRKNPWTSHEDSKLKVLLKQHKYGYAELSKIFNRSAGAIQKRCNDLGLKERPVKADNHGEASKWTESMYETLANGIRNGDSYALIGELIGKSEKAIRGKIYTVYLTENADKIRQMLGDGPWGNGAPVPIVKQAVHLSNYRTETKAQLSTLAGILKYRMNELGYDPYWQRHVCLNWDHMEGCTAKCTDCDSCTEFRRIPPQYCARCGITFFEREENRFCKGCRIARKKRAQRHWMRINEFSRK